MCGLRTCPRMGTRPRPDVDPPRVELPSAGGMSSRRPRAITCLYFIMGRKMSLHKLSVSFGRSGPHLTPGSLGQPESISQTASRSVQPFWHSSRLTMLQPIASAAFGASVRFSWVWFRARSSMYISVCPWYLCVCV